MKWMNFSVGRFCASQNVIKIGRDALLLLLLPIAKNSIGRKLAKGEHYHSIHIMDTSLDYTLEIAVVVENGDSILSVAGSFLMQQIHLSSVLNLLGSDQGNCKG